MGIRKKCLIITLLCFSSLMYASEFMFKHLEVKDGLSNNQVLDIFKDSEGFMWFATASGLNRYDGCQMTLFRSYNADPASLPDNYICLLYTSPSPLMDSYRCGLCHLQLGIRNI